MATHTFFQNSEACANKFISLTSIRPCARCPQHSGRAPPHALGAHEGHLKSRRQLFSPPSAGRGLGLVGLHPGNTLGNSPPLGELCSASWLKHVLCSRSLIWQELTWKFPRIYALLSPLPFILTYTSLTGISNSNC